jgi:hypothetical protein
MPLDQAKLALVAYALVSGADGSSTVINSGVTTTRLGMGTYAIDLPVNEYQYSSNDLIQVQIRGATPGLVGVDYENPATPNRKVVYTGSSPTTALDLDFTIQIWTTLDPPAPGGPS